jgi:hypothetical protein
VSYLEGSWMTFTTTRVQYSGNDVRSPCASSRVAADGGRDYLFFLPSLTGTSQQSYCTSTYSATVRLTRLLSTSIILLCACTYSEYYYCTTVLATRVL